MPSLAGIAFWGLLARLHGGFFVIDGEKLGLAVLLASLLGAGTVIAVRKVRGAKRVALFTGLAALAYFLGILLFFDVVLSYPIIRVVSYFPLP